MKTKRTYFDYSVFPTKFDLYDYQKKCLDDMKSSTDCEIQMIYDEINESNERLLDEQALNAYERYNEDVVMDEYGLFNKILFFCELDINIRHLVANLCLDLDLMKFRQTSTISILDVEFFKYHHHPVNKKTFERMIINDKLLDFSLRNGHYFGYSKDILDYLEKSHVAIIGNVDDYCSFQEKHKDKTVGILIGRNIEGADHSAYEDVISCDLSIRTIKDKISVIFFMNIGLST